MLLHVLLPPPISLLPPLETPKVEYYAAVKKELTLWDRVEALGSIMPSVISPSEKDQHLMISLICGT